MAFIIKKPGDKDGFRVVGKVYVTRDGSRVVDKTNPSVGSLFASPGDVIDMEDAVRLGLVKESKPAETKESKPEGTKEAPKPRRRRGPQKETKS